MIYCVIPRELEGDLYDKLVEYYKDNSNVTVIVDRREGEDRRSEAARLGYPADEIEQVIAKGCCRARRDISHAVSQYTARSSR